MPVILLNVKSAVLAEIQRLVDAGLYESPGEFLALAATNQLELERKENGREAPAGPRARASRSVERPSLAQRPLVARAPSRPPRHNRKRRAPSVTDIEVTKALAHLRLPRDVAAPQSLALKPPVIANGEERVWGQVNRLLPLKVAVRWLAAFGVREGGWADADAVLDTMGADAATIGTALDQLDADAERMRDELLATGLPRRANALSIDRFLSQYVARTTRKGAIYPGAAIQYGMVSLTNDQLALTTTGFEFAALPNPIIDGEMERAVATLSNDERQFFVQQAIPNLPSEVHEFSLVLSFVSEGRNTPTDQVTLLRGHLPTTWSDTMVRTHVTGVVARMVDLGILHRQWQGRHVQYGTTQLGADFARTHPLS